MEHLCGGVGSAVCALRATLPSETGPGRTLSNILGAAGRAGSHPQWRCRCYDGTMAPGEAERGSQGTLAPACHRCRGYADAEACSLASPQIMFAACGWQSESDWSTESKCMPESPEVPSPVISKFSSNNDIMQFHQYLTICTGRGPVVKLLQTGKLLI